MGRVTLLLSFSGSKKKREKKQPRRKREEASPSAQIRINGHLQCGLKYEKDESPRAERKKAKEATC